MMKDERKRGGIMNGMKRIWLLWIRQEGGRR